MSSERLQKYFASLSRPQVADQLAAPAGFMWCPLPLVPGVQRETWATQQRLYQLALEQARAVVRPSLPERASWALEN